MSAAAGWALAGGLLSLAAALACAAALVASAALGPTGRHRLREQDPRLDFVEALAQPPSAPWLGLWLGRTVGLLVAGALAGLAAWWARGSPVWALTIAGGSVLGGALLEALVADSLALRRPRAALRLVAPLVRAASWVSAPLASVLAGVARAGSREATGEDGDDNAEAEALIEVAEREGILEEDEGRMIRGIVDLDETRVREIMTPRPEIVAVPAESRLREALQTLRRAGHTRFPVYRGSLDEIVGILHVRDVVAALAQGRDDEPVAALARPAMFVPETLSVGDLLERMRTRTQIAVVVDEYGSVSGLVTLEDVLEEIVGEIRDEHDPVERLVQREPDGSWTFSGGAHVEELAPLGVALSEPRDYDTVGGFVTACFGRVPRPGEVLETHGLRIEVLEANPRQVRRVRIRPLSGEHLGGSGADARSASTRE